MLADDFETRQGVKTKRDHYLKIVNERVNSKEETRHRREDKERLMAQILRD